MRYAFADCVLDTDRRELHRAGEVEVLRPKVYQVLVYLIEHRDRVIPKDELLDKCWPGRVVSEATLSTCLKHVRVALGDSGSAQKYIKTLHGHGFHFIASLEEELGGAALVADTAGLVVSRHASEREFKQVSVLSCRVPDAGDLAEDVGPEEMDALMRGFFASARLILSHYGGTVTQWHGDGFTALFGAPQAFEDHARRAALAAVELRETMQGKSENGVSFSAGLHTGQVIVGSLEESDQLFTAVGSTTAVAHRIREAAGASILASEAFYRLIETDVESGEVRRNKGLGKLFEIKSLSSTHGGVPRRGGRKRSRFVGRDGEMAITQKRLAQVKDGSGQVVCVSGEPGIGKSRLLQELRASFEDAGVQYLQGNCLAYSQSSPYRPLLQLIRSACGVSSADAKDVVGSELRTKAADAGVDEDGVELLLSLLDAPVDAVDAEPSLPQSSVEQVFACASRLILNAGEGGTLVIAIEDLHWLDTTTEQWLGTFVQRISAVPVLLLVTYRPGYQSAWLSHSHVTQLALPRLNDADSTVLIGSLAMELPDAPEIRRRIVNNAQGNPFFLEELTFNLADGEGLASGGVPTTVQAVLASRIDQLEPNDKVLLQTAAVIGTGAPHELLEAVDADLDIGASIARLERAEFLFEDPTSVKRQYMFKHALTRDVAYQSLLSEVRRERHRQIAEVYERHFADLAGTQPELVAHHFFEAGVFDKAMDCFKKAGIRAAQRWANPEAVKHFESAIEASEALPQTDELKTEQLDIYLRLGPPLMSSKAFTSPAVEAAYLKARHLCDEVGTKSQLLTVLWGLWLHYAHRGRIDDARPLARHIVEIAEDVDDEGLRLQAHHAVWTTEIWHGDLELCYEHAKAGSRLYDPEKHASHKFLYGGHDPGVCALGTAAIAAWFLGRPQECIELTQAGADLADQLDHPYSRIITMHDFMEVEALRGNPEVSGQYGRMAIEACTDQRVPNYLAVGHIFAGYGKAAGGDFEAGMAEMKDALQRYRELGAERNLASYLLHLADICLSPEHFEEGTEAVDEAAELISHTGEVRWLPEIRRLNGELLLLRSEENAGEAGALFEEALQLARKHGCKSFELRAATSLARLMKNQGQDNKARTTLAPVYEQFQEGFDTRDLQVASELLEALA